MFNKDGFTEVGPKPCLSSWPRFAFPGRVSRYFLLSYVLSVECLDLCWARPTGREMVIVVMPHRDCTLDLMEVNTWPTPMAGF